jgi:hypothetical protein
MSAQLPGRVGTAHVRAVSSNIGSVSVRRSAPGLVVCVCRGIKGSQRALLGHVQTPCGCVLCCMGLRMFCECTILISVLQSFGCIQRGLSWQQRAVGLQLAAVLCSSRPSSAFAPALLMSTQLQEWSMRCVRTGFCYVGWLYEAPCAGASLHFCTAELSVFSGTRVGHFACD